jgi:hypothetical protein
METAPIASQSVSLPAMCVASAEEQRQWWTTRLLLGNLRPTYADTPAQSVNESVSHSIPEYQHHRSTLPLDKS